MFKLLTEEARVKVIHEYSLRRWVVVSTALVAVLVMALVGLFPSYTLSKARQNEITDRVRVMNDVNPSDGSNDLQQWFTTLNQKLTLMAPTLDQDRPHLFIDQVIQEKRVGIILNSFMWTKEGNMLVVSGVANDRQTLLAFQNRLNTTHHFGVVTIPISSLAKDKNITFQVKLSPTQTP